MNLTQKETDFCKDFKAQEQLCVDKYTRYAAEACNQELRGIFGKLAQAETQHLNAITDIMNGNTPSLSPAPSAAQATCPPPAEYADARSRDIDAMMCNDMLAMEKHASLNYNIGIFEFNDPCLRDTLATIEKEEQNHGKQISCFMQQAGMSC